MIALDASALLAFLFRERGHEQVGPVLSECCLSTVNLSEVLARFVRDGYDPAGLLSRLRAGPIEIVPFDADDAAQAAALQPQTRSLGLSLGDRACLALAQRRDIPAMTADRIWMKTGIGVPIRLIR